MTVLIRYPVIYHHKIMSTFIEYTTENLAKDTMLQMDCAAPGIMIV